MIIMGMVGVVAGALVTSGAWLLFGNDDVSSSPIAAPHNLNDYVPQADARPNRENERGRKYALQHDEWDRRSSARLSESHDGAGAVVQTYSDDRLDVFFQLEAFRAPTPAPYVPYTDPKVMGFDKPSEEVLRFGDVACAVRNTAPKMTYVATCLRSNDALTVQITRVSGDLGQDPRAIAGLVDVAWQELA